MNLLELSDGDSSESSAEPEANDSDADSPLMRRWQSSLGIGQLHRVKGDDTSEDDHGSGARAAQPLKSKSGFGAEYLRFNLHAGVTVNAGLPSARERLLRYCARAPLASERLGLLEDGRVSYRIKQTDQVRIMTPIQFMARLAALVPPPRHPLVRFYGVFAPHSQWRSRVVPVAAVPKNAARVTQHAQGDNRPPSVAATSDAARPAPRWPRGESTQMPSMPAPASEAASAARFTRLSRLDWATLEDGIRV